MNTSVYRPEIDGLRAIAVFGVIIYHSKISFLGVQIFQGGFYGVDIFFVISGYLISKIIISEYEIKKKFSYLDFYERRMRRILPLLFFVLLTTLIAGYFLLFPSAYSDSAKSIIYSIFFSSNIFFFLSGQAYDALNSLAIPLLHTWSLSVEEQFYIFFPFLIIFLFTKVRSKIIKIFTIIIIFSLIFSNLGSFFFESLNFYILPSRLWELLIGSVYFFYENSKKNKRDNKSITIFPLFGLFLILFSFIFINDNVLHPSIVTMIPIAGTILILNYSNKDELLTNVLSSKLFVFFGLISYSLYLWHYPIFAFSRIHLVHIRSDNIYIQLLIAAVVILLSIFTYFFIEKPFRNKKLIRRKYFFYILFISLIILITASYKVISNDGLKQRIQKIGNYEFDNQSLSKQSLLYTRKHSGGKYFSKNKIKKILLVGDSHAKDLFNAFHLNQNLFKDMEFIKISSDKKIFSIKRNQKLFNDSDVIIFSHNWKWIDEDKSLIKALNEYAIKNKKKFLVIGKRPNFNYLDLGMSPLDNYLFRNQIQKIQWKKVNKVFSKKYYEMSKNYVIRDALIKFVKENDIKYLDPYKFSCDDIKKNV